MEDSTRIALLQAIIHARETQARQAEARRDIAEGKELIARGELALALERIAELEAQNNP